MGQIATFMETLHLSYKEVTEVIPYRNLLLMQRDKIHEIFGEKLEEMSHEEYMKTRGKDFNN